MYKLLPKFFLGMSLGLASLAATVTLSGCHKAVEPAAIPDNSGPDPSDANMAPVDGSQPQAAPAPQPAGRVLGIRSQSTPQQNSEQYAPQSAPPPPKRGLHRCPERSALRSGQRSEQCSARRPELRSELQLQRPPAIRRGPGRCRPAGSRRGQRATSTASSIRTARSSRAQLSLDSRILGIRSHRLLLGPRRLVRSALLRSPLDPRLLGLLRRPLSPSSRLLGAAHRFLRWC